MYDLADLDKLIPECIKTPICTVLFYTWPDCGYRVHHNVAFDAYEFVAINSKGGQHVKILLDASSLIRAIDVEKVINHEIIKAVKELEKCHTS